MSIGLYPQYSQNLPLDNVSAEQFLVISIEVSKNLGWNLGEITNKGFTAYSQFSVSSWNEININIDRDTAVLISKCTGAQVVDWGENKRNIDEFVSRFNEIKVNFTDEELAEKYKELKGVLSMNELTKSEDQSEIKKVKVKGVAAIFVPVKGFFITPLLIDLNIIIFILMAISGVGIVMPNNESLLNWGANFRPLTLDGQWWRLLTNIFLHAGIFHLLMNMYALLYIGILLEPHLGRTRFLSAYLLSGIAASIASLWWHEYTLSVGASGAIFGMYGVFLAMLTTSYIEKSARKALLASIGIFVGYNLLSGVKGNIDNAAHIGGLISGVFIGYVYLMSLRSPGMSNMKYLTIAISFFVIVGTSFAVYDNVPNFVGIYESNMKSFVSMESMALEIYTLRADDPKEEKLSRVKRGLYYWNENIKLLHDLNKLKLPEQFYDRDNKLIEYCNIRIKMYNLIYKSIDENTDKYNEEIKTDAAEIAVLINEVKQN